MGEVLNQEHRGIDEIKDVQETDRNHDIVTDDNRTVRAVSAQRKQDHVYQGENVHPQENFNSCTALFRKSQDDNREIQHRKREKDDKSPHLKHRQKTLGQHTIALRKRQHFAAPYRVEGAQPERVERQ